MLFRSVNGVSACYVSADGTGAGSSWQDACSLQSTTAITQPGFNVYVKSGTYNLTSPFTPSVFVNYYGGFKGNESSPSDRPLADLDGNGIVESREFQYPTILNSTVSNTTAGAVQAFTISNAGYVFDGFTLTHTGSASSTGILKSVNVAANVRFSNNTISNSSVSTSWSTTGSGAYSVFFSSTGVVNNCLFENNRVTFNATVDVATYPFITVYSGANSRFSNTVVRNNLVTANWGSLTTNSGLRSMLMAVIPGAQGFIPTVKNCIFHNNELNYSSTTPGISTSSVGATVQMHYGGTASAIISDSIYNCTLANNKANNLTNAGLRFTQSAYTAHYAANNVCWNNKSVIGSASTISNIAQSSTLTAPSLLTNHFSNGGGLANSGTVVQNANMALSSVNTGNAAPLFKSPTTVTGAGWTAADSVSIKQSSWQLQSGSFLIAKGVLVSPGQTDKSGNAYAIPPSVGAYEYVAVNDNTSVAEIKYGVFPVWIKPGAIEIGEDAEISVYSTLGVELRHVNLRKSEILRIPSGVYILKAITTKGVYAEKVIITQS